MRYGDIVGFVEFSSLTSKGQTTVPKPVRQALGLSEGDKIAYEVADSGVTLRRADDAGDDPAITAFLGFLARDIQRNPGHVRGLPPDLAKHIEALVGDIKIDPDDAIEGEVDL
ncbi:antitoxin PrlF [Bradyrhizobium sp. USDA 377]